MPRPISVEMYTASHRILGRIEPGPMGLFSYLNIPTTNYLEVEGALLNRLHQPSRMVARYQTLWVVKDEIVTVLLSTRGEIGPSGVARGGYSTMVAHWVHLVLGGYELRGQVETPGKFNYGSFMIEGDRIFIPMYNTELIAILFPDIRASSPAMLFNREMVDAIALLPKEAIPPRSSPETAQALT
ncbi:MAG TPA: hypothetical protein VIH26_08255 [Anaerolineales bacterium]